MKKIISKPYLFFLAIILLFLLLSLIIEDETFSLNMHDVYFVITKYHLLILLSFLSTILGLGYFVMLKLDRGLFKLLSFMHILFTFLGSVILLITFLFSDSIIRSSIPFIDSLSTFNMYQTIAVLLIIFGQLFYPFNILFSLFRRKNEIYD